MSNFHAGWVAHGNGDGCVSVITSVITLCAVELVKPGFLQMDFLLFMELLTPHEVFHAAGVLILGLSYTAFQCL